MKKSRLKVKYFLPVFISVVLFTCFASGCDVRKKARHEEMEHKIDASEEIRSRDDYEEAIKNFRQLLESEPDNIILLISLGNAYFDTGRDKEAIEIYNKALHIYPENVSVITDLGTAYRRIGRPDKALNAYRKSLGIDFRHSITRYNLGVVLLWDKKDIDGAIKVWEELLRIDPYFVFADELKNNIEILKQMRSNAG